MQHKHRFTLWIAKDEDLEPPEFVSVACVMCNERWTYKLLPYPFEIIPPPASASGEMKFRLPKIRFWR